MPFTEKPPVAPFPLPQTVRLTNPDGTPTREFYDFQQREKAYRDALSGYLKRMAAAIG